jgi:alanyl-tRNA synthetase
MTDRLYYRNAYAVDFHASVIAAEEMGDRVGIVLDRTAFYPTSGGQPFDTGTLGEAQVVEVAEREDGTILHVVEGPVPPGRVTGKVAWDRRFDHMQQHTGQHILSAAFQRLSGLETVGFHLGAQASTIDLAREATAAELEAAERAANDVIWEDRPVSVRFVDAAEAASLPLRRDPVRRGPLRIIEIADYDASACGGTHVARTGAVGIILVGDVERVRGGTRVEFRCGGRALAWHRLLRNAVGGSVTLLSGTPAELPRSIERIQEESRNLRRRLRDLEARTAVLQADVLAGKALWVAAEWRVVLAALEHADAGGLKALAQAITTRPRHAVVLCTMSTPLSVVVASSDGSTVDAAALLKALIAQFGGKGGGRPELAQGAGVDATQDALRTAALALVQGALDGEGRA